MTKALRMKNVWERGTTGTLQNVRESKETKDAGAPEEEEEGAAGLLMMREEVTASSGVSSVSVRARHCQRSAVT